MTNKKINLDTDFLDEDEKIPELNSNQNQKKETSTTLSWKILKWSFITLWILIFVIIIFSDNSNIKPNESISDISTSRNNDSLLEGNSNIDDNIVVWKYSCTKYYSNEADRISPSSFKKTEIDKKLAELNTMDSWIDNLETEINSFKLNKNSQSSIDIYNGKIDRYDSLISKRKVKYSEYENLLDSYNTSVDTYNNYLERNCTKRY